MSIARLRAALRRNKLILSIRARLIVLALLAISPLMLERVHGLQTARAERILRAQDEAVDLARRGAEGQREIIYSVRALLQVVARVYPHMPPEPSACNQDLRDLTRNVPWLRALSIAGSNGQVRCSTNPRMVGLNVADRAHFQNAVSRRDFAISDYVIGRVEREPSLVAAFPAVGEDGAVTGVALAMVNLRWLGDLTATVARRPGESVFLIDGAGTLIAASADQAGLVGKRFADLDLVQDMLRHDDGALTMPGFDGVRRVFAYVRVPWTQARLAVGLDQGVVQADIDHEIDVAYAELGLFGAFVLLLAWFGGEQLIVRPIRRLVRTAARFGRGDLHVRATEEPWAAEFEPLAAALDDMAAKLAAREEELQIANQHLDELASLDGLTGLANRRGFDRELEREWRRAAERGAPLALMMIDIDHFKLFNDRYGHVLVARYGGEEFGLLLPGLDLARVAALAEEARRSVEDLAIAHADSPCGMVTVSIGVESLVPRPDQAATALVEAADNALYDAKRRGRNKVVAQERLLLRVAS